MSSFTLNLQRRVEAGLTACGKFDGSHACLTVATSGGNVLVHSPHRETAAPRLPKDGLAGTRMAWYGELAELQIGRQVCSRLRIYLSIFRSILLFSFLFFFFYL